MAIAAKALKAYEKKPVAVLCMRYWYRGILSKIEDGYVVLSDAKAVEQTGSASGSEPDTEDPIPSDVIINLDAVEIVCQPAWVWHGFKTA